MNTNANREMLILARQIRGVSQTRLSEISGIDQGTISKYEGGLKPVLEHDLEAITKSLGFPTEFFYRAGRRVGAESGEIFHRKQRALPAEQLNLIHAQLNMLRLNVEKLLEVADASSRFEIPRYEVREFNGDIDRVAEMVRSAWKIPPGPVFNLVQVLEAAYCMIHTYNFGTDQIDETVQWIEPLPPVILVNSRAPGDRLRFTLAHALGHLVLHHDSLPYPEMEDEADRFAAAFLMPAEDIEPELDPVTIEHMLQLKPAWKVSVQALIRRARDVGKIDDRRLTSMFQMLSRAGYRRVEPFPLPAEEPTLFKKLINLYQHELGYSPKELAQLLSISEDDFWDWYMPDRWRPRLIDSNRSKLSGKRKTNRSQDD